MSKKLLALDLDGTLLSTKKEITSKTLDAMNEMLDKGHFITIDSGRPIFGMKPITDKYDIFKRENFYLLGNQGGLGFDIQKQKTFFVNHMDHRKAVELAKYVYDEKLFIFAFDESFMYVFEDNDYVVRYNKSSDCPVKVVDSPEDFMGIELCKIIVCSYDYPELLVDFKNNHEGEFADYFSAMFSCPEFLEFIPKGTGKDKGLQILADLLKVDINDTIAVGDERNDITMLKAAGIGCCMANGADEAKAVADYITENDNDHDGIAEVIYKFILK